jgi:hypothetical protein
MSVLSVVFLALVLAAQDVVCFAYGDEFLGRCLVRGVEIGMVFLGESVELSVNWLVNLVQ